MTSSTMGGRDAVNLNYFSTHEVDAVVFYGDPTRIYRARRRSNGMPVMLKTLRDERAAREAAALLKHEYEMARRVNVSSVIRVFSLERHNNLPVIELEDFGGDSLDNIARQRRISLEELLGIAVQLTQGLIEIHAANIIHKDINPSNIVYNPETGVAKIIDFGISTHLTREQAALTNAERFEGSLPYISPEQTGRMNRSIDYRTDFYSLGVTLYELLTGRPLFIVKEPIEWFHCHIAKQPVPPVEIDPAIPLVVSDIVMKLLAKTAEDRYQSAQGVHADLRRCLDDLVHNGQIAPFAIASEDVSDRFQIPQRLYGRENEVAQLLANFDRLSQGGCRMILVSGYSGIGKTCLIKEIYKPITERRGHFVAGKFDQLHRNMPYYAFAAALRDLVRQLLTEPETVLSGWRNHILEAVDVNGQLMIDMIRELELIIGPQPPVPEASPLEAEQRFHRVFQRFIQVFCGPEHPLVIFLDDLQWTDSASMRLLDLLTNDDSGTSHLMLIGAYRDNEVSDKHPVALWLKDLRARDIALEEIILRPLGIDHLTNLLSDTLGATSGEIAPLVNIVEQKTAGNPFFTEEFLKALHLEGLITFSREQGRWTWDIDKIPMQQMTDNVVALMTAKLKRLSTDTQALLKIGACVGFRFDLYTLSVVSEEKPATVASRLQEAIVEGLIAPIGDAYQLFELELTPDVAEITVELAFAHDRIHQAVYALLDNDQRSRAHLKIGRLLQHRLPPAKQNQLLFEITNHLNLGSILIEDCRERTSLCRLNLSAGKHAISANAYHLGFEYFKAALVLLPETAWDSHYSLVLELYSEAAEAAYLSGDYDEMDRLLTNAFSKVETLLDKVKLYEVQVAACMARGQLIEALNTTKSVLAKLGHHYPAKPKQWHVIAALLKLKWCLRGKSMDDLRKLPEMTDPNHLAAMRIVQRIGGAAMFAQPHLLPLMIFTSIKTALKQGYTSQMLIGFAGYGMILTESLGQAKRGKAFCELAMELAETFQVKAYEGRIRHIYNALVRHWVEPVRNCLEPLHRAFLVCLENGDFEYAAHAVVLRLAYAYEAGMDLKQLYSELSEYHATLKPLKQGPRIWYLQIALQKVDNLMGNSADPVQLKGRHYDSGQMKSLYKQFGDFSLLFFDGMSKMQLFYMFGRYEQALNLIGHRQPRFQSGLQAMFTSAVYWVFDALIRLANAPDSSKPVRRRLLQQANRDLRKLRRWSRSNPANYLNKVRLIEAEQLRVRGQSIEAHGLYDDAIRLAGEQNFIHEKAMASELCGLMHINEGRATIGEPYLARARDLYHHWGAQAKVRDLEQRFPQIVKKSYQGRGTITGTTTSWGAPHASVDIGSLIKALRAIAEESVHSRMVEAIIATALEFAGAQRGMLMLRNPNGVMCIEAEANVDGGDLRILQSIPVSKAHLAQAVVNYVGRTCCGIVVQDAQQPNDQMPGLTQDLYIREEGIRSILCLPILTGRQEEIELIGMLYLENNLASGTFTQERFDTLEIICLSAAGRLELSRKAVIDGLTELYNHDYFQNILNQEFISSRRHNHDLSLLLIDIDHFKRFNDTWGHQVGDQVLREVAQVIKAACRSGDTVARYGGEEMAVILPLAKSDRAEDIAERIRIAVENHRVVHKGEALSVTISLGLAIMETRFVDKDDLIRGADTALYRSKANGRNRLTVC